MPDKRINESPTISDRIIFDITTPDVGGCFSANPYKVDRAIIFFVERSFTSGNDRQYDLQDYDPDKLRAAVEAEAIACTTPTPENIAEAKRLREVAETSSLKSPVHYNKAVPVKVFGNDDFPAWLSTDLDNALMTLIPEDEEGNAQYGRFELGWEPKGEAREGDYFICWTWTMQPAGEKQSAHQPFVIAGDTQATTSIPSHHTVPDKYETLLERYLPQMFKEYLGRGDLTPDVMDMLNKAVAKGFTSLEDQSNQIIDLFDANSIHEAYLPFLSNLFNLKLKSGDPTLWRRQVKEAIPLFKKKGTRESLKEGLAQAGIEMTKFTQLWQVISPYTWIDAFKVENGQTDFVLSKIALSVDPANFELSLRRAGEEDYTVLTSDYVTFDSTIDEACSPVTAATTMTWVGDTQATPIALGDGDIVKVLYLVKAVPGPTEQLVEDYIRTLPLADLRDETAQDYPPKNWNVRVIEEDDPLIDVIIKSRHPFREDVVFGHVRTEFPYSENIYNMEEYNGSTRPSTEPCDISKEFLDPCGDCISSKFILDVEVQELSNDKLVETAQVVNEYVPFHSILHSMNISGGIDEFVQSPVEDVECLINYRVEETIISGEANTVFHRIMNNPLGDDLIKRTVLASSEEVLSEQTGIGHNQSAVLYCPDVRFDRLPLNPSTNVLEIFAPSPNAGIYTVSNPYRNSVDVQPNSEPVNQSAFTFRLSNDIYFNPSASIVQDDIKTLGDTGLEQFPIRTRWDVDNNTSYTSGTWKVTFTYGTYEIADMASDGSMVLYDPSNSLPTSGATGLSYDLLDDSSVVIHSGTAGRYKVLRRGRVTINDVSLPDISLLIHRNDYLLYGGNQYRISGFVPETTNQVYLDGYAGGGAGGVPVRVYRRLVDNQVGYFHYKGLMLQAFTNLEQVLNIQNGANAPDVDDRVESNQFMENYMVEIEGEFYAITAIDGNLVTLGGSMSDWKTLASGGTVVVYTIHQFNKNFIKIDGNDFRYIDRRGAEAAQNVQKETLFVPYSYTMTGGVTTGGDAIEAATGSVALGPIISAMGGNGSVVTETVTQDEAVSYTIEYADGSTETGEIQ